MTVSDVLADYLNWPGAQQVFPVKRKRVHLRTGKVETETVYGVTSLRPGCADAGQLLELVREHWHIENGSHWVRDVTYDEDRSQVREGSIPQVMAAFRNLAIGLIRITGTTQIAAATRRLAAQPWEALALLGIPRTFK